MLNLLFDITIKGACALHNPEVREGVIEGVIITQERPTPDRNFHNPVNIQDKLFHSLIVI